MGAQRSTATSASAAGRSGSSSTVAAPASDLAQEDRGQGCASSSVAPRSVAASVECRQVGTAAHGQPLAGDAGRRSGEPSVSAAGNIVVAADTFEVATAAPLRAIQAQVDNVNSAVITRARSG